MRLGEKDKLPLLVEIRFRLQLVSKAWALSVIPHCFSLGVPISNGLSPPWEAACVGTGTHGEDDTPGIGLASAMLEC